jgi:hypothetical protein
MTTGFLIVNILPGGPAIIDPVREGFSPRKRPPVKVFFRKFNKFGSSPISLIKYFMKTSQGQEGKSDCAASIGGIWISISSLLAFRKAQRGREKKSFMR